VLNGKNDAEVTFLNTM